MEYLHFLKVATVCAAEANDLLENRPKRKMSAESYSRLRANEFINFFREIRKCSDKFLTYFRMSVESFDELLKKVGPLITKQETSWRSPVNADKRLAITLRYLATGSNYTILQREFNVAKSTISVIVSTTCQAIWLGLKESEIPEPTKEEWYQIADIYQQKTDFPNCLGALGVKDIRCNKHLNNFKNYFSVPLIAVADTDLRFLFIHVGAYGPAGRSAEFRDSLFARKLYAGELDIPEARCLPGTDCNPQPFVFVGDEAFKIHSNLLRPFGKRDLNPRHIIYNDRLSRARRSVECAFGLLANKWRIFHKPLFVGPDLVDNIIKACCVLHNFVVKREGANYDGNDIPPFFEVTDTGSAPRGKGIEVRDVFAEFFDGMGDVPCQQQNNL